MMRKEFLQQFFIYLSGFWDSYFFSASSISSSSYKAYQMTTSALIIMISTWTVITFYTVKFFLKVVRTPNKTETDK